jgi:hypothetical protein
MIKTNISKYIQKVLDGELEELRKADGGRNNCLFRVATRLYQFVEGGSLDEDFITNLLVTEVASMGLPIHEIRTTLKSARHKVLGKPANVPALVPNQSSTILHTPDPALPPSAEWQNTAAAFLDWSRGNLKKTDNKHAIDYMASRKIGLTTLEKYSIGYNPNTLYRSRNRWGLSEDESTSLVLPEGIVIPYFVDNTIWKIEIRSTEGKNKHTIAGSANAIWGLDGIDINKPAMMTEGVINGLTIAEYGDGYVQPIALGAITHARKVKFMSKLSSIVAVLISTDSDVAGESGANWWKEVLQHNAVRWKPLFGDINEMAMKDQDVKSWLDSGLDFAFSSLFNND